MIHQDGRAAKIDWRQIDGRFDGLRSIYMVVGGLRAVPVLCPALLRR